MTPPLTRQGVRDLNGIGVPVRRARAVKWTCPPHLPSDYWERINPITDERVMRCRTCKAVLDTWMPGDDYR